MASLQGELEQLKKSQAVTEVVITTQQLLRLFWRLSRILKRLGLPENLKKGIQTLTSVARAATYTYFAMHLLEKGTIYGTFAGFIGMATTAFVAFDVAMSLGE